MLLKLMHVQLKVLVYGDKMLMAEFKLATGAVVPEHEHPHEQAGYVVSGRIRMNVKGKPSFETGPGGAWSIPGDILHSAEVLELFRCGHSHEIPGSIPATARHIWPRAETLGGVLFESLIPARQPKP